MYTGGAVRLRSFALVLAFLVAAAPVIDAVCQMDCGRPPAASSPCHEAGAPQDGPSLRGAPHACDHRHTGGSPARVTSAADRDEVGILLAVPSATLAYASVPEARTAACAAMHGPPGLGARSVSSRLTALRI